MHWPHRFGALASYFALTVFAVRTAASARSSASLASERRVGALNPEMMSSAYGQWMHEREALSHNVDAPSPMGVRSSGMEPLPATKALPPGA